MPDFKGKSIKNSNWDSCSFQLADFTGSDLSGSSFVEANMTNAVFVSANLATTNFTKATLLAAKGPIGEDRPAAAQFTYANLADANLTDAYLDGANFAHAIVATLFGNAVATGVKLNKANFAEAYVVGANFDNAELDGAVFTSASLVGSSFRNATLHPRDNRPQSGTRVLKRRPARRRLYRCRHERHEPAKSNSLHTLRRRTCNDIQPLEPRHPRSVRRNDPRRNGSTNHLPRRSGGPVQNFGLACKMTGCGTYVTISTSSTSD